jgi:predicted CopG family antitoxin
MSSKTITVTEDAYEALRALKEANESFSDTILRVAKRKPLSYFCGSLSKGSGEKLEKTIMEMRRIRSESHKKRIEKIAAELKK